MLSKSSVKRFGICALFAALFFGAALPAAADEADCGAATKQDDDAAVRQTFVDAMTIAMIKSFQLRGMEVSPERQAKFRAAVEESFPKIYARIKAAGFGEDYRKQMFDPDIRKFDKRVIEAKTVQEANTAVQEQIKATREKYPKLFEFIHTDKEMEAAAMEMMLKIAEAIK